MIRLAHPMIEDDERAAVAAALDSGQLAQGPRVAAFEREFAALCGARHAIALNSGTAALHVAQLAHGIGDPLRGLAAGDKHATLGAPDEVIVPAFSYAATANAVLHAGARPVFVDVRDDDFGIDAAEIEAAITPRTRGIIAVHLYGQICDIGAVADICARRGLVLIEDAAQAVGAAYERRTAGSWGTACFSFYATKNLQTGEGGMITTNDAAVAERARILRSQGETRRYVTEELGYNFRMTEPAAALGLTQLAKLEARTARRRANAGRLSARLAADHNIILPRALPGRAHVWHQYVLRVRAGAAARDALQADLRERGIESAVHYPIPIPRQPLYRRLGYSDARTPVADRLASDVLSIPVHPALSDDEIDAVATAVNELTS